jgi:gas vesicle protein
VGEEPDRIRREIEQTRAEMGETVDALTYKADIKSRAKERVVGAGQSVRDRVIGAKDSAVDSTPDREQVAQQARRAKGLAQDNPLGFAIGSIAVGFVAGMLVPSTRVENEKLGPVSDQVTEKAKETGQEALEHGKEVARETAQQAQETLSESAQQHGQQVGEAARQNAQEVRAAT